MNIGIVTTWYERGAAYVSRQYAETLRNAGHNVFIFARDGEYAQNDPVWNTPDVHWAKTWPLTDSSCMQVHDFKKWLIKNTIDLVLFNEQRVLWPLAICQELNIRTVAYIDYYRETSVRKFTHYDGLICNTLRHYSVFDWHPGALYLPWGTDTDLFKPQRNIDNLVSPNVTTFFHSAGRSDRKGTDLLIQAFAKLQGPSKLIIHSQKNILDWFPSLKETIGQLQTGKRLELIHDTVTAPGLYHLGDVYVYPTRLEGIGLTICEAMSCGLPAIVPDNAPMNEFVQHHKTGLLAKVESYISRSDGYYWPMGVASIDSLAEQMKFCLNNPDWVLNAKTNARSTALMAHNWQTNSKNLPDYLENLMSKGAPLRKSSFIRRIYSRIRNLTDI